MYALAIHGGAGVPPKDKMSSDTEAALLVALRKCIDAGEAVLRDNGTALDAVTQAVCALENDPHFNAGRGAVFNSDGKHEMDAAVMLGQDRNAGAVAGIMGPRNPILAARAVMEQTNQVMMIGPNALNVARAADIPFAEPDYFFTQKRWDMLQETLRLRQVGAETDDPARRHGTVGAVALDVHGNLAAATSTGGITAKAPGRVGDTPCIGAGTFADNETCAVSCTGYGEIFLRRNTAYEIASRMRHADQNLEEAAQGVVQTDLAKHGGSGGVIALDRDGNVAMPFNCNGMYRGQVRKGEQAKVAVY